MAKHLSVAIIEPVGGHGGMDYYDFGLCAGLLNAGFKVSLYTCDETRSPDIPGLSFQPVFRGIYGEASPLSRAFRFLRGSLLAMFRALTRGERICHLHVFHGSLTELFEIILARLFCRTIVLTVHDVESFGGADFSNAKIGWVYNFADRIVVHNHTCLASVIERLGLSPEKIKVIPMGNFLGILDEIPEQRSARSTLKLELTEKIILFFGHIKEVKGLDLLLAALPTVVAAVPNVRLLIAGRTWKIDFSEYTAMMEDFGIRTHCTEHIRHIPDDEVPLYYSAADVVALPYRRIYQSAVLLMALSCGKAVLVSDLPAMTEIIRDGVNGFTFSCGSHQDLAQRLIAVLQDDNIREAVANYGQEDVRRRFDWSLIGKATASLYEELLS